MSHRKTGLTASCSASAAAGLAYASFATTTVLLVAHILERERLDSSEVWMIGDRAHDIVGGRANCSLTLGAGLA
jgi:phosphoglycolate phosphatase-like HAD superfamily hydrolase